MRGLSFRIVASRCLARLNRCPVCRDLFYPKEGRTRQAFCSLRCHNKSRMVHSGAAYARLSAEQRIRRRQYAREQATRRRRARGVPQKAIHANNEVRRLAQRESKRRSEARQYRAIQAQTVIRCDYCGLRFTRLETPGRRRWCSTLCLQRGSFAARGGPEVTRKWRAAGGRNDALRPLRATLFALRKSIRQQQRGEGQWQSTS